MDLPIDDETLDKWFGEMNAKKWRIRKQSKQVASYIASNDEFYEWFEELEGFHIREERFWDDCDRGDHTDLFQWVRWAFHMGFEAGRRNSD